MKDDKISVELPKNFDPALVAFVSDRLQDMYESQNIRITRGTTDALEIANLSANGARHLRELIASLRVEWSGAK